MSNKSSRPTVQWPALTSRVRGAALITALGMLMIFMFFGLAFLKYMSLEKLDADNGVNGARAAAVAEGGIRAAMGEIQTNLAAGQPAPRELTFEIPEYRADKKTGQPEKVDTLNATAKVTITDECARVNLNEAPTAVLQSILNVDGTVARRIRASLPRDDSGAIIAPSAHRQWLSTVDDLVNRGLLDPATYDKVDKNLLTVYSVADNAEPGSYINLNTAPPKVLAAALNLTPDKAKAVASARDKAPFKSVADLRTAVGKGPDAFNFTSATGAPDALPSELAFSSRCFRIHCKAEVSKVTNGENYNTISREVEAIVYFRDSGGPLVQYWGQALE